MWTRVAILLQCILPLCTQSAAAVDIEMVTVGNPGNSPDPLWGGGILGQRAGSVDYVYQIGKYEVTFAQYTAFLNAVAKADTYGLYDPKMASDRQIRGIAQNGSSGNFIYSVIGSPNHPVTYVSWGDAARFANWLHNGQPTGAQDASTTEGGAYTLNGAVSASELNAIIRNSNARWFIPSGNEWYKAAYYQPVEQGGDADNYWLYPMRTNQTPISDQPPGDTPDNTRVGNFNYSDSIDNGYNDGFAVTGSTSEYIYDGHGGYLVVNLQTDVGAYTASSSFFGTFDQGGNVAEWSEFTLNSSSGRLVRGGSWDDTYWETSTSTGSFIGSAYDVRDIGFRVASLPGSDGDFNGDTIVDAADYGVWRKGLGTTYTQTDYDVWRTHFGQGTSAAANSSATGIPEPASTTLFSFAAMMVGVRRGRARRG